MKTTKIQDITNISENQLIKMSYKSYELIAYVFDKEILNFSKSKASLLCLKVTDFNDSIIVKKWIRTEEDLSLTEIETNSKVKLIGYPAYDSYHEENVFILNSAEVIGKFEKKENVDTASVKRVELHVHTNRSKLDGLDSATKYIKEGSNLGLSHIAITDFNSVQAIPEALSVDLYTKPICGVELSYVDDTIVDSNKHSICILAANKSGLSNIFRILSEVLTNEDNKQIALRTVIDKYRTGILIGYSFATIEALSQSDAEIMNVLGYFDYVEVLPPDAYMDGNNKEDNIKRIVEISKDMDKIAVAVSNCRYIASDDNRYYEILTNSKQPKLHLRTTNEMLEEFSFLQEDLAYEIVVSNTNLIASKIEDFKLYSNKLLLPKDDELKDSILGIPSIKDELNKIVNENLKKLYGDNPDELIINRVNMELDIILNNNYEFMFYISHVLIKKSLNDGYITGSRGMVGGSLISRLMNITEINPLPPHYRCNKCKYHTFEVEAESGFDLPDSVCPHCGSKLIEDGHNIPFESFLGLNGEKVPDIDMNFSGVYQAPAHSYLKEIMGSNKAFKAGTIGDLTMKNAYGYASLYFENNKINVSNVEKERIANRLAGIKRSLGRHPGGIIILPSYADIHEFTPIENSNDSSDFKVTHINFWDYYSSLFKLDILGHDNPTIIKHLMDYVNKHEEEFTFDNPLDIPVDDKNIYKLFNSTDILGIDNEDNRFENSSLGIPEFGSDFVRYLLEELKPKGFMDLVKISGLSHGTNTWTNNAEVLYNGTTKFGKIPLKDLIGCREDIMIYLMDKGFDREISYEIMEFVRKGKASRNHDKWSEYKAIMKNNNIPDWFIWSCEQIHYLFPRAHAASYVLLALKIAWFKVYSPALFYSTWLSFKCDKEDANLFLLDIVEMKEKRDSILNNDDDKSYCDAELVQILEIAIEAKLRGIEFLPSDNEKSTDLFEVENGNIRLPK